MSSEKQRAIYIASLLVLACLLVLFAHGVFAGLFKSPGEPVVEINRIDLYDSFIGNYSKVSVMILNNDTLSHDFRVVTLYDGEVTDSYDVTINEGRTFTYQRDVLPERIPISRSETIESTLKVAKFVVYMDDNPKPIEEASFVFKK